MKKWTDMLSQEEVRTLVKLENEIAILKHRRYKIQNAATKRITDAEKAKARKRQNKATGRKTKSAKGRPSRARPSQAAAAGRSAGAADTVIGSNS